MSCWSAIPVARHGRAVARGRGASKNTQYGNPEFGQLLKRAEAKIDDEERTALV